MKFIISQENVFIKEILQIKKKSKEKSLIEGLNLIKTAIEAELKSNLKDFFRIEKVLVTEEFVEKEKDFFEVLKKTNHEIITISKKISNKISDTITPQGVFAIINYKILNLSDISEISTKTVVILDRIQDPGNLGTIIRASEALGADLIVITSGTCHPLAPKVLRASGGSIFYIPVVKATLYELEKFIRRKKLKLILAEPKAKNIIFEIELNKPLAVVFGNENQGVSKELKKIPHISCRIPHTGKTESLNVAMSASIILYEILRNRLKK